MHLFPSHLVDPNPLNTVLRWVHLLGFTIKLAYPEEVNTVWQKHTSPPRCEIDFLKSRKLDRGRADAAHFKKKKKFQRCASSPLCHGVRWSAEVTSAGLLLGGLRSPLDVGDLQDGHQQLESILDVRRTVGCLWGRRIYHTSAWSTQSLKVKPHVHTSTTYSLNAEALLCWCCWCVVRISFSMKWLKWLGFQNAQVCLLWTAALQTTSSAFPVHLQEVLGPSILCNQQRTTMKYRVVNYLHIKIFNC